MILDLVASFLLGEELLCQHHFCPLPAAPGKGYSAAGDTGTLKVPLADAANMSPSLFHPTLSHFDYWVWSLQPVFTPLSLSGAFALICLLMGAGCPVASAVGNEPLLTGRTCQQPFCPLHCSLQELSLWVISVQITMEPGQGCTGIC
ncbi:hypothetical protein Q8A73_007388 [Channa argus]|nr:hypothetical protein Q8A73_007388 [Channa argus]